MASIQSETGLMIAKSPSDTSPYPNRREAYDSLVFSISSPLSHEIWGFAVVLCQRMTIRVALAQPQIPRLQLRSPVDTSS